MIENGVMRLGGNTIKVWLWKRFAGIGTLLASLGGSIEKLGQDRILVHRAKSVANPAAKLINPFTMMITFTVDVTDKYQIILQGDYKQQYRDSVEGTVDILAENLFIIINQHQKDWFKKD